MMLKKLKQPVIMNEDGKPLLLTAAEKYHARYLQRQCNERFANVTGYEVDITTLTTIVKKITTQKFFEIPPADYFPLRVGEGAWSSNILTYRTFDSADQFETGIVDLAGNNARRAMSDTAVDSVSVRVFNWGKTIAWSIMELEMAAKSGNWDLVTSKEKARKRNWDLGIQRIAFLGARGENTASGQCLGLLNLGSSVQTNTTTITKPISTMTTAELKAFQAQIIEDYRSNCQRTAWPDRFIIPESDYNGLASQASPDFPIKSTLELLEEAFKLITRNANFRILPLAYADTAYHQDISADKNNQIYTLLRYDDESIRMDVPVDYTTTLANSIDNFGFQNAGYGQFTGVGLYRPREVLYFKFAKS